MDKNNIENSTQEKDKHKNKNEYAIYEYLKMHPGMLISCISAMVMVITFIINYAIYLRTSRFLVYWGVEALNINMNNTNLIYTFAGAFIYYMMIMYIQPFIIASCEKYVEEMNGNYYIHYFRKKFQKKFVQYKKMLDSKKKSNRYSDEQDKEFGEIEQYIEESKKYIKESKKIGKKLAKIIRRKLIISIILAFFVLSVATFFLFLMAINITNIIQIFVLSIVCAGITLIITMVVVFLLIRYPEIKKIKKEVSENKCDVKQIFELNDDVHYEYPIDKIFNLQFKESFRDKAIILLFLQMALGALFLILLVHPIGANDMQKKQEFAIVNDDGQDYVIIYNNDNCYYLIEAIIENEKITIDTTRQSVVIRDRITYENMKFEEVIRYTLENRPE